jgi:hypothetical protein
MYGLTYPFKVESFQPKCLASGLHHALPDRAVATRYLAARWIFLPDDLREARE